MDDPIKPNILFLLVDSFRTDKCFGRKKTSITPNLDLLIQNGVYFTQTISCAPVTIPSISSILTGQYPFKSIVRDGKRAKLNPDIHNFISHLKTSGYSTIAIIPKLLSLSGLADDFENINEYPGHDGLYDGIGEKTMSIFRGQKLKSPWFFYVHLLDLHGTARGFPAKFDDKKYGKNQYERMVSAMDKWLGEFMQEINFEDTLVVLTADHGNDAGIYTPDMELDKNEVFHGHMVKSFKFGKKISSILPTKLSPLKSKMKTIYAEKKHKIKSQKKAEKLEKINQQNLGPYETRVLEHAINPAYDVFDDRFLVPLLFTGYGVKTSNVIQQQVRTVDIFPTILEIIKIPNYIVSEGTSLLPLIDGLKLKENPAYLESIANWNKSTKTEDLIGIRHDNYKYFRARNDHNENIGLYHLKEDPHEEYNLADKKPEKLIEMEKILSKIYTNTQDESETDDDLGDSEEEKLVEAELKKLGYL